MNDTIKQRLVGAAVLLILAGLLWPIVFDFDESMRGEPLQLDIPEMPQPQLADRVDTPVTYEGRGYRGRDYQSRDYEGSDQEQGGIDTAETVGNTIKPVGEVAGTVGANQKTGQRNADSSPEMADLSNVARDTVQARKPDDDRPQLDEYGIPVSYIVQVATFSRWANAVKFRDELIESRLKAYIKPGASSQTGPYQVAVGPVLTYQEAEVIAGQLKQDYNINDSIIRRFRGNS